MNRLSFPFQVLLAVLVALAAGFLLSDIPSSIGLAPTTEVSATATIHTKTPSTNLPTPIPLTATPTLAVRFFEDTKNVWLVRVTISQNGEPSIDKVVHLEEGRISPSAKGDSTLRLLDQNDRVLYEISFSNTYLSLGEVSQTETTTSIFFIPSLPFEKKIEIITPQGKSVYEIP